MPELPRLLLHRHLLLLGQGRCCPRCYATAFCNPPSCCCICMSPHVPQTCVQKRCPSSCSFVTNQIYGCWNNTKAHNAGVNQAEAVVSWICFCGSSVSLEKKHGDTTQWTEKKRETWQRMMTWEDERRAFSSAPHHSMTADTPAAHKFSIYDWKLCILPCILHSHVPVKLVKCPLLPQKSNKQKTPQHVPKTTEVYLQSEVSLLLPKQPALSWKSFGSPVRTGQAIWPPGFGHCALLTL